MEKDETSARATTSLAPATPNAVIPSTCFQDLPRELVFRIMEIGANDEEARDPVRLIHRHNYLKAIRNVCHTWRTESCRLFLEVMHVFTEKTADLVLQVLAVESFDKWPIRFLKISSYRDPDESNGELSGVTLGSTCEILRKARGVRRLSLRGFEGEDSLDASIFSGSNLSEITHLELVSVHLHTGLLSLPTIVPFHLTSFSATFFVSTIPDVFAFFTGPQLRHIEVAYSEDLVSQFKGFFPSIGPQLHSFLFPRLNIYNLIDSLQPCTSLSTLNMAYFDPIFAPLVKTLPASSKVTEFIVQYIHGDKFPAELISTLALPSFARLSKLRVVKYLAMDSTEEGRELLTLLKTRGIAMVLEEASEP